MAKKRNKPKTTPETEPKTPKPEAPEPEIECGLPKKDLFRVDEVARYFDVGERTIRLWIEHGLLTAEKYKHQLRVPRQSIIDFRLASRVKSARSV